MAKAEAEPTAATAAFWDLPRPVAACRPKRIGPLPRCFRSNGDCY
jgi:hypothetical protein